MVHTLAFSQPSRFSYGGEIAVLHDREQQGQPFPQGKRMLPGLQTASEPVNVLSDVKVGRDKCGGDLPIQKETGVKKFASEKACSDISWLASQSGFQKTNALPSML